MYYTRKYGTFKWLFKPHIVSNCSLTHFCASCNMTSFSVIQRRAFNFSCKHSRRVTQFRYCLLCKLLFSIAYNLKYNTKAKLFAFVNTLPFNSKNAIQATFTTLRVAVRSFITHFTPPQKLIKLNHKSNFRQSNT